MSLPYVDTIFSYLNLVVAVLAWRELSLGKLRVFLQSVAQSWALRRTTKDFRMPARTMPSCVWPGLSSASLAKQGIGTHIRTDHSIRHIRQAAVMVMFLILAESLFRGL